LVGIASVRWRVNRLRLRRNGDSDERKNAENVAESAGLDSGAMADISGVNSLNQFSVDEYNKADDQGPLRSNAGGYGRSNMGR